MEDLIRTVIWIVVGIIWFVSAIARRRMVQKTVVKTAEVPGEHTQKEEYTYRKVYEASEGELARFLRSISGVEEIGLPRPLETQVAETGPIRVEPEPEEALATPYPGEPQEIVPEAEESPVVRIVEGVRQPSMVFEEALKVAPISAEVEQTEKRAVPQEPLKPEAETVLGALGIESTDDLKKAIIIYEILGPPRAIRGSSRFRLP